MKTSLILTRIFLICIIYLAVSDLSFPQDKFFEKVDNKTISIKNDYFKRLILKRVSFVSNFSAVRNKAKEIAESNSIKKANLKLEIDEVNNNLVKITFDNGASSGTPSKIEDIIEKSDLNDYVMSDRIMFLLNMSAINIDSLDVMLNPKIKKSLENKAEILSKYTPDYKTQQNVKWIIDNKEVIDRVLYYYERNKILKVFGIDATPEYLTKVRQKEIIILVEANPIEEKNKKFAFYWKSELLNNIIPDSLKLPLFDETLHLAVIRNNLNPELTEVILDTTGVGKEVVPQKNDYNLRLSLFDPKISFNYFFIPWEASLFGKWGYDEIPLPGWYNDEYVIGLETKIFESNYTLKAGYVARLNRPWKKLDPDFPFYNSGESIYLGASGSISPLFFWERDVYHFIDNNISLNVEGRISLPNKYRNKGTFDQATAMDFYSLRKFIAFDITYKDIMEGVQILKGLDFGNLSLSLGANFLEIQKFRFDPNDLSTSEILDLSEKYQTTDNWRPFAKVSLTKEYGYTTHNFNIYYIKDIDKDYYYVGSSFEFLFGNWIGLQGKVFVGYPTQNLPPYAMGTYGVIGPVIKF